MRKRLGQRKQQFQEWQREFAKSWICHFSPKNVRSAAVLGDSSLHAARVASVPLIGALRSASASLFVVWWCHNDCHHSGPLKRTAYSHSNVWTCPQLRVDWSNLSLCIFYALYTVNMLVISTGNECKYGLHGVYMELKRVNKKLPYYGKTVFKLYAKCSQIW